MSGTTVDAEDISLKIQLKSSNLIEVESESEVAQLCPTLCDPMNCSPPGSSIHGIFPARVLEWVAISFSKAWKWKVKVKSLSRVRLLATPWTAAHQVPPSMGFSRQEYWSGLPLPSLKAPLGLTKRWSCINLEGWNGEGDGRQVQKGGDICVPYGWFTLRFDRKENAVKQLSFN